MDSLPLAIVQYILSLMSNARDVAACSCVSKQWKDAMPYIRSLHLPRNSFDYHVHGLSPDTIIRRMISSVVRLEELVVYCPFSGHGLASWLSSVGPSLRRLELRMDNREDEKLECLKLAANLESLKLWGVYIKHPLRWNVFQKLKNLEIVSAMIEEPAFNTVLCACPNLSNLLILDCAGPTSVSIELKHLERCKLDVRGSGNCSLTINSPKIQLLDVQGCSRIIARGTSFLTSLSISSITGRVKMVDFDELVSLEFLSIRGVRWCWGAISKILEYGSEVKHLYMKVQFTGDSDFLEPFPEVDFVDFFNNHPKLQKFDIHGAMFSALCHKNSLKNVDPNFIISSLEEVSVTIRSPTNAEQKMNTLNSLIKYGQNLKTMSINILKIKISDSDVDGFFDKISKLYLNHKIVRIE